MSKDRKRPKTRAALIVLGVGALLFVSMIT